MFREVRPQEHRLVTSLPVPVIGYLHSVVILYIQRILLLVATLI